MRDPAFLCHRRSAADVGIRRYVRHREGFGYKEIIRENFEFRPAGIIKMLDLRRPIYKQTAAYGHFGRLDVELPWEKLDKADDLKKYLES